MPHETAVPRGINFSFPHLFGNRKDNIINKYYYLFALIDVWRRRSGPLKNSIMSRSSHLMKSFWSNSCNFGQLIFFPFCLCHTDIFRSRQREREGEGDRKRGVKGKRIPDSLRKVSSKCSQIKRKSQCFKGFFIDSSPFRCF